MKDSTRPVGPPIARTVLLLLALASLPAVAFFANWSQRGLALSGVRRARETQEQRGRELAEVARAHARAHPWSVLRARPWETGLGRSAPSGAPSWSP